MLLYCVSCPSVVCPSVAIILSGDEDNGEMGAWFVFSAIGFYPIAPGKTNRYFGVGNMGREFETIFQRTMYF
jgi:hypothetical protein